jgi:hypothetical protein
LLSWLAVAVLTIYGFRVAPTTRGLIDDRLTLMLPWLQEAWVSFASIALASSIATLLVAEPIFARIYQRRSIKIVFPNKANLDHKQSLFRRSNTYLPSGNPAEQRITGHSFFVGIKNTSQLTVANVGLKAHT